MPITIDPERLSFYLTASEDDVAVLCDARMLGSAQAPYWFVDRGAHVLAVAHLDWVHSAKHTPQFVNIAPNYGHEHTWVFSPALDDRLGAYIIGDLLPQLHVPVDVLFTFDEETGRSSAKDFQAPKAYNWLVEFDRRGTDVVGYQYQHDSRWRNLVTGCKLTPGQGSNSDIAYLDRLGVLGFNFGVGYYLEHTPYCYADLQDTCEQLDGFLRFFDKHSQERLPYDRKADTFSRYTYQGNGYQYGKRERDGVYVNGVWTPFDTDDDELWRKPYSAPVQTHPPAQAPQTLTQATADKPLRSPEIITPEARPVQQAPFPQLATTSTAHRRDAADQPPAPAQDLLAVFRTQQPGACEFCADQQARLYYDDRSEVWLCRTCCGKQLLPHDVVLGYCTVCGQQEYFSVWEVLQLNGPLCAQCANNPLDNDDGFEALRSMMCGI